MQRSWVGLSLFVLFLFSAGAALAEAPKDALFLFTEDGKVYVAYPTSKSFLPTTREEFAKFGGGRTGMRTVNAETRLHRDGNDDGQPEAKLLGEADYQLIGMNAHSTSAYGAIHRDASGNYFVEVSNVDAATNPDPANPSRGLNFLRANQRTFVPPARQKWVINGAKANRPLLQPVVGNPSGAGVLTIHQGRLYLVTPPAKGDAFEMQPVAGLGDVQDLFLVEDTVFVHFADGNVARLVFEPGGATATPIVLKVPEGMAPTKALISSNEPEAQRRLALAHFDATSSAAPGKSQGVMLNVAKEDVGRYFLRAIRRVLTDKFQADEARGNRRQYSGREAEMKEALSILIAMENCNPVITGEAGSGKTAIVEMLAQKAFLNLLPVANRYQLDLNNSVWVESNAAMISALAKSNDDNSQSAAVANFVEAAHEVQKLLGRPLVIFIDEMHMLSKAQRDALKPFLSEEAGPVRFIFATTNGEYSLMVQRDEATRRRTPKVHADELDVAATRKLLKESLLPRLTKYYANGEAEPLVFTDDAVEAVLRRAREYEPGLAFPSGPIVLALHAAATAHTNAGHGVGTVDAKFIHAFVKDRMGLRFDPTSPNFPKEMDALREQLKERIVEQPALVDKIIDNFETIVDDESGRPHRFLLVAASTGVGKTYGAEETLGALVGKDRVLVIDCSQFTGNNVDIILNKLLGAPPGIISSDQFLGILPEFLSGRGRGINGIVWNEVDKMSPEAFRKLMEMIDTGIITGNDGKEYRLGRSLNVMTTNKGASNIQPRGREGRAISRAELEQRLSRLTADEIKQWFLEPKDDDLYDNSMSLPPEVVERIHDAMGMLPPTPKGAAWILRNVRKDYAKTLKETKGVDLSIDDDVIEALVKSRYSPEKGVREPKRQVIELMDGARRKLRRAAGGILPEGSEIKLRLEKGVRGAPSKVHADLLVAGAVAHTVMVSDQVMRSALDAMRDPVKRDILKNLEKLLAEFVFGQDDMIATLAELVRNQMFNAAVKDPVSALLLGPTGTGKSELAKALAKVLFGSEHRTLIMPMGNVDHPFDLAELFNPPKGVQGSQTRNRFEKFLRANRGIGGVILLDEIGNMGGGDPKQKAKLLKKFFEMLDEGIWTNPTTGEVYDLRDFVFILTSNEGQEKFEDAPSDDERNAIHEYFNDEDKLAEFLARDHGWPPALIARLNAISMARPLSLATRAKIAKKFLDETHTALQSSSGIKAIRGDENFYQRFGESFFTHERGARRMRVMIQKKDVASLITRARLELDPDDVEGSEFVFSMEDSYTGRYRFQGAVPDKRKVVVKLQVVKDGRVLGEFDSGNIAKRAAPRLMQSETDTKRTAAHEAGHAVANLPEATGLRLEYITVQGAGRKAGYARYKSLQAKTSLTREEAVLTIAYMLAGNVGQELMKHPKDSGWSGDLVSARKFAQDAIAQYGLGDDALRMSFEDGKVNVRDKRVQAEMQALLEEGLAMARKRLKERWDIFQAVYEKLMNDAIVTGPEFDAIEVAHEGQASAGDSDPFFGPAPRARDVHEDSCASQLYFSGQAPSIGRLAF